MSNFKIGEKVVCVDSNQYVKKNDIYTIVFEYVFKCGTQVVSTENHPLCDLMDLGCHCGCGQVVYIASPITSGAFRFRKLDYAHTERICAEIIESLKVEELQMN